MTKAQKLDLSSVEVTPSLYPSKKRKVSREVSERRQKYKRGVRLDQKVIYTMRGAYLYICVCFVVYAVLWEVLECGLCRM